MYRQTGINSKAYTQSLRSQDVDGAIEAMKAVMKDAYYSEYDLFVTRLCLEVLIRCRTDDYAVNKGVKHVVEHFRGLSAAGYGMDQIQSSPLLNFAEIACEIIKMKDFEAFKQLLNHYAPALKRDDKLGEYLEKVVNIYFEGKTLKPPNPMEMMMKNMMGGGAPPALGGK